MTIRPFVVVGAMALAGAVTQVEAQRVGFGFSLGAQQTAVDSVIAADRGMASTGPGFHLGLDLAFKRYLLASLEVGAMFYKDLRPFSQSVVCIPNCGGGSSKSTINTTVFGMAVGLQTPRYQIGRVGIGPSVRVGTLSVNANRGVNCSDCDRQDLALEGGVYVEYRLTARFGRSSDGVVASIGRRSFFADDALFAPSIVVQFGAMVGK